MADHAWSLYSLQRPISQNPLASSRQSGFAKSLGAEALRTFEQHTGRRTSNFKASGLSLLPSSPNIGSSCPSEFLHPGFYMLYQGTEQLRALFSTSSLYNGWIPASVQARPGSGWQGGPAWRLLSQPRPRLTSAWAPSLLRSEPLKGL